MGLFDDDFLTLGPLENVVTDSHFAERDRMGRLVAFVARMWTDGFETPAGIGVDESTALLIGPSGQSVVGSGSVHEVTAAAAPEQCEPGEVLGWSAIEVTRRSATEEVTYEIAASSGDLEPADPY